MNITITVISDDDEFEDIIKISKADFDTQEEYQQFLRQVYKFEFNRFLIDADIVLDGETYNPEGVLGAKEGLSPYNEALDMYIELDTNRCMDDAMDRIERFNNFIDTNNRF